MAILAVGLHAGLAEMVTSAPVQGDESPSHSEGFKGPTQLLPNSCSSQAFPPKLPHGSAAAASS